MSSSYHEVGFIAANTANPRAHLATPPDGFSNRVLVVWIFGDVTFSMDSGPTWNSVAMTEVGTIASVGGAAPFVRTYRLVAPISDGNEYTLAWDPVSTLRSATIARWVDGIDQVTPNDTQEDATVSAGTSVSDDVTSAVGDLVVGAVAILNNPDPTFVPGAGQTDEVDLFGGGSASSPAANGTVEAGAVTVTWSCSWTGNEDAISRCINLNAVAAGTDTMDVDRSMPRGLGRGLNRGLAY